jgi:hypothetical protein
MLRVAQVVKKCVFSGTRGFITLFTRSHHRFTTWSRLCMLYVPPISCFLIWPSCNVRRRVDYKCWNSLLFNCAHPVNFCSHDPNTLVSTLSNQEHNLKMTAFWDVTPCSLVEVDLRFRGEYCLHHHDAVHDCTALHPWKLSHSYSPPWEPEISQERNLAWSGASIESTSITHHQRLQLPQEVAQVS